MTSIRAAASRDRNPARSSRSTAGFASAAMLVSYLPFSAVNGTLGNIGRAVSATTEELAWVADSFTIALVLGVFIGGLVSGPFGARRVTTVGLALTTGGSIIGLAGASLLTLWVAQAVVGLGAGLVMSASLQLIGATSESAASRTRAIAVWAAANVAGLGVGPFLAVASSAFGGWAGFYLPVMLLAFGVAGFGAVRALESSRVSAFAGANGMRSIAAPDFAAAGVAAFAALLAVIGVVFTRSIALNEAHIDSLGIALQLACLFAGNAIASAASGPLQVRFGSRRVLVAGLLVTVIGLVATSGGSIELGDSAWRLSLLGLGAGAVVASSASIAVRSAPAPLMGLAGTANTIIRQIGGTVGPLVLAAVSPAAVSLILLTTLVLATLIVTLLLVTSNSRKDHA